MPRRSDFDFGEDFFLGDDGVPRKALSEGRAIDEIIGDLQSGRTRTAINKLRILRRLTAAGYHKNPPDAESVFGKQVLAVEYIHSGDGKPYRHDFGKGVTLSANPDGSLRIAHATRRVWEVFR